MPVVRVNVAEAEHLETEYNRAATAIDTTIGDLSTLLAEASWLLETRSSPLYGPLPSLRETASGLHNDRDDLTWRVDYLQTTDGQYLRGLDMLSGYTPTVMPDDYLDEPDYSEALAAFRRAEAQSWTERTPLEQADHSLDQIRTILDTAKHDRGRGVGATVADGIWSTEDLEVVIENEHGYYTPAQQRHAQTVLTMATSSPEARDHLGITQSDDGWSLTDIGHLTLDVFGMVPGVGNVADGINASWYAAEGEFLDAALSSMALIPGLGQVVTPLRNAIRTATDGRVFRTLREAMEWIRRWLHEAGIWRFAEEAGEAVPIPSVSEVLEPPYWTSTRRASSSENALRHFRDHAADFPDVQNAMEYMAKTQDFLRNPPGGTLTRVRTNGDIVRYHPTSNTFAVMDASRAPRTMYLPDPAVHGYSTNLDYFYAQ